MIMIDFTRCRAAVLALALAAAPALGQVIYKSTMPDGRVIYGDAPVPGALKSEATNVPKSSGVTPVTPTQEQPGAQAHRQDRQSAAEAARAELQAAESALAEAQAARQAGREPLEGERQGTAGGGNRLSESYFQRQQALETAVGQAQQRVEAARLLLQQAQ
jgi:hypothetical protein